MPRAPVACVMAAALSAALLLSEPAAAGTSDRVHGWLAVHFEGSRPSTVYDVRIEGAPLTGTDAQVQVEVLAVAACAAGTCRPGTIVDLGARLVGADLAIRAAAVTIPRGARPEVTLAAPIALVDAAGVVWASGHASMVLLRARAAPRGQPEWRYHVERVMYRFGAAAPPVEPPPPEPAPTPPTAMLRWEGVLTGGFLDSAVALVGQRVAFDLTGAGLTLAGTHIEPGSVSVREACWWPGCSAGTTVSLGMHMVGEYAGRGAVTIGDAQIADSGLSGGFRIETGLVTIPPGDDDVLVLQAPFTLSGLYYVTADNVSCHVSGAACWGLVRFDAHGTATLVMERVCFQYADPGSGEWASQWRYVPRRLTYTVEP